MTAEQAANLPINSPQKRDWILQASAKDLHQFIHLAMSIGLNTPEYELAKTSLNVRIAEEASQSTEKLTGQTNRLIEQVTSLNNIAEEQRRLALTLEKQTRILIWMTGVLCLLTFALLAKEVLSRFPAGK